MTARYGCRQCAHYAADAGQCRRHAPPWPTVAAGDWCGEFMSAPASRTVDDVAIEFVPHDVAAVAAQIRRDKP